MTPISPTRIKWNYETMKWEGLTTEQIQIWEAFYGSVDVIRVLKVDIPSWLDRMVISRNPLKINTKGRKRNWKTFIVKWLKREEMKARGVL